MVSYARKMSIANPTIAMMEFAVNGARIVAKNTLIVEATNIAVMMLIIANIGRQ